MVKINKMNITDKMGGFLSASIIPLRDIESYKSNGKRVDLVVKSEVEVLDLPHRNKGISLNISEANDKNGTIYNINLQIELKNNVDIDFLPFNQCIALVIDSLGRQTVLGTPSFPLTATKKMKYAPEPSGFTGEVITIVGKQPIHPLNT